jgi:hypothetical protein
MLSLVFVLLASICNAIMDTISFHYEISIFNKSNPVYWNPQISWKNKYIDWDNGNRERKRFLGIKIAPTFLDAWHLFKSMMIIFLALAIVLYEVYFDLIIDFVAIGIIWNITFILFYNKLLIRN